MSVAIIDYGAGNIASVKNTLARIDMQAMLTSDPEQIKNADYVIFPGVGEATNAMRKLRATGLDKLIPTLTQPVLGICLGMQLMCQSSEEGPTTGLNIFPVQVKKFKTSHHEYRVPHMGWNRLDQLNSQIIQKGQNSLSPYVYFVHSYYAELADETSAVCDYIQPFSAALEKDNFYGVQFHPEKSGDFGQVILERFLSLNKETR